MLPAATIVVPVNVFDSAFSATILLSAPFGVSTAFPGFLGLPVAGCSQVGLRIDGIDWKIDKIDLFFCKKLKSIFNRFENIEIDFQSI